MHLINFQIILQRYSYALSSNSMFDKGEERKVEGRGRGDVFKGREKWFEEIWRDKMPSKPQILNFPQIGGILRGRDSTYIKKKKKIIKFFALSMTIYKYFFKLKKKFIIFNLYDVVLFPLLSVLFLKTSKQKGGISILLTLFNCTLYPFSFPLLSPFLPPCSFYSHLPPHFQTQFKSFQSGCHICTY